MFIMLGNPKLPLARREAQKNLNDSIRKTTAQTHKLGYENGFASTDVAEKYGHVAALASSLSGLPPMEGNAVEVLSEYEEIIWRIVKDIDGAKKYVQLEYYVLALDETTLPVFEALGRTVDRGVDVRVMYDWWASMRTKGYRKMVDMLDEYGVLHQPMLPFRLPGRGYVRPDLRNHRKLIAIDAKIGYVGSQNLIRRNYHRKDDIYYDEIVTRIEGQVVAQISAIFISDWYAETGVMLGKKELDLKPEDLVVCGDSVVQMLPSGPGYDDENNLKVFTELIHTAKCSITIVNPYFVPDEALMTAITSASKRGVDVTMINSETIDQWAVGHAQRSFYEELLKADVKLHLYKAPILLHSKYITIDGELAVVGSSNLDIRSFLLDLEVTMISYDRKVVDQLDKVTKRYLARSKPITLGNWQSRPARLLLLDNIARLTSALQ